MESFCDKIAPVNKQADNLITIIEGPTPIFETTSDYWSEGITEGPEISHVALVRLRTYNGAKLVERCHVAWKDNGMMYLHFKNEIGLEEKTPIFGARFSETSDGQILFLWVKGIPNNLTQE